MILSRDKVTDRQFWKHECPSEGSIQVEKGEPCNWCDAKDNSGPIWRTDCGYNHFFQHEIVWQSKYYDGSDTTWRNVGINHAVLHDINTNAKGKYGWNFNIVKDQKIAMISFENEDDALWFRLKHSHNE